MLAGAQQVRGHVLGVPSCRPLPSSALTPRVRPCSSLLSVPDPASQGPPVKTMDDPAEVVQWSRRAVPARKHEIQASPEQLSDASTVNTSSRSPHESSRESIAVGSSAARAATTDAHGRAPPPFEHISTNSSIACTPRTSPRQQARRDGAAPTAVLWHEVEAPMSPQQCCTPASDQDLLPSPLPSLSPPLTSPTRTISPDFVSYFNHRADVHGEKGGKQDNFQSVLQSSAPPTALYILETDDADNIQPYSGLMYSPWA